MSLEQPVYSVLIVSASESFNLTLSALLPDLRYDPVRFVSSVSDAKRIFLERHYDFVIINSPLPDDVGTRFAVDICSEKGGICLILVKSVLYDSIYNRVYEHGVYVLPKPMSKQLFSQALDFMTSTLCRIRKLEKKTVSIEEKMEEIRMVNRAKWLLIERLKMTESDAHRYIEKQAMDRCVPRREIAENIIKTYL